jgi:conjugative transfer signal peptidase TraF
MARLALIVLAALTPAPLALAALTTPAPSLLLNTSPSEPLGLYRRVEGPPRPGDLVAFRPPEAALDIVARAMPGRRRSSFLKTIAAGEGALACVAGDQILVEGRVLGAIASRDRAGRPLPRWAGCRRLGRGEWLVFSGRIPNSFDSRYYGPVPSRNLLGVYAPLWVSQEAPGRLRAS